MVLVGSADAGITSGCTFGNASTGGGSKGPSDEGALPPEGPSQGSSLLAVHANGKDEAQGARVNYATGDNPAIVADASGGSSGSDVSAITPLASAETGSLLH